MTGYVRQSAADIVNGLVVEAQPVNDEFDQLQAAMDVTAGHAHNGNVGEGPKLDLANSTTGTLAIARGGTGVTNIADFKVAYNLVIGTDVQAWNQKLANIVGLTSTGVVVKTGTDTFDRRILQGTSNEITVVNGDGVAGAPTFSLPSLLTFTGKNISGGVYGVPTLNTPTMTNGTWTNATINSGAFNGSIGATTPNTGAFTTMSATNGTITILGSTAITTQNFKCAGVEFNTGNAIINDYKRGSFTPTVFFNNSSTGITGTFTGDYLKVGDLMFVKITITLTSKGSFSAGDLFSIRNLPFTTSLANRDANFVVRYNNMLLPAPGLIGWYDANVFGIKLKTQSTTDTADATWSQFNNTSVITLSGCYNVSP